ncbi:MAG TPA: restriction endonuclease subunit S [Deltaproteobacteria bacterium]|nr:restriction endonuclease subunit S [Deltaproteobacteria bacterium]
MFDRTGWKRVRFGDVVANLNKTERDPAEAGIERFIGLEHLEPGSLHIRTWGNVVDGTTFTRRCRPGQVLFGKRRAYQRKVAVAEFDAVVSGDIYVFAPGDGRLISEFLPFICLSERFFQYAVETSAGSLSPRTGWKQLAGFEFDLPPLEQQRRIAEVLWAVDEVYCEVTSLTEISATLHRACLRSVFATHNSNNRLPVRETGFVQLGRQRAPKYQTGTMTKPYLRVANVFDGRFDYDDILKMDFDERDFEAYHLEKGDILLNEGQSRELVGRCAIYDGTIEDCCFQNTLIRYRAGENVLTEYAYAYFQYCFHFGIFAAIASQTTSVAHLGAERFGTLLMPVPQQEEQRRIAQSLDRIHEMELYLTRHLRKVCDLQRKIIEHMIT